MPVAIPENIHVTNTVVNGITDAIFVKITKWAIVSAVWGSVIVGIVLAVQIVFLIIAQTILVGVDAVVLVVADHVSIAVDQTITSANANGIKLGSFAITSA